MTGEEQEDDPLRGCQWHWNGESQGRAEWIPARPNFGSAFQLAIKPIDSGAIGVVG